MKIFFLAIIVLFRTSTTWGADTLKVKQDGTGDYLKIQDAINAADNGTVILVYPGTYYENVTYQGKTLTLGSLYLVTGADSIISQTIIDGNHSGSCVRLENFETNCRLVGFTLQNGSGTIVTGGEYFTYTRGGGIRLYHSNLSLEYCIIKNNVARSGGGISSERSNLFLKGNIIFNNHARVSGGGIDFASSNNPVNNLIFNQVELNSLFINYSSSGFDLAKDDTAYCNKIILDTGTIQNPNHYYFLSRSLNRYAVNDLNIEIHNWKIQRSGSDLYVSPEGDDQNSGHTPDNPLKTIAFALLKIKSDSTNPKTVHLAEGTYSLSQTGEKLALGLKSYVALEGAGREKTIIDAENKTHFAYLLSGEPGTLLKNLSFTNGYGYHYFPTAGIDAVRSHNINFDSINFNNCKGPTVSALAVYFNDTTIIHSSLFESNKGQNVVSLGNHYSNEITENFFEISSSRFLNNTFDSTFLNYYEVAICIPIQVIAKNYPQRGRIKGNIINTEITNTLDSAVINNIDLPASDGILASGNMKINIINSTLGNNFTYNQFGAPLGLTENANVNIYNSIIWGNVPYQTFTNSFEDDPDSLYIYHSCVENGLNGINIMGPYDYVYYDDSTNIESDPQWLGYGDFPYNLSSTSPCIDAGALNLPDGVVLPDKDLAGNPRIFNGKIDMGAYEWNPTVSTPEYRPLKKQKEKHLSAAPNPFDWGTYLTAKWEKQGNVRIEVFNNGGLRVKTLKSGFTPSGESEIQWIGDDQNGNYLPPGIYHIVMYIDGKEIESLKVVKK